jgi:hypothetical protein
VYPTSNPTVLRSPYSYKIGYGETSLIRSPCYFRLFMWKSRTIRASPQFVGRLRQ